MQTVTKKEKLLPIFSNKNVDMKKEMLAGLTTFLTMAYIIAVNPSILSATGINLLSRTSENFLKNSFILFPHFPFFV